MNNHDLEAYIGAIGWMFQDTDSLVVDTNGGPAWSTLFDPATVPEIALAWLAQIVGVRLERESVSENHEAYIIRQRSLVASANGQHRGTKAAMIGALAPYLTGNKTIFFQERDTSAYRLTVITRTSETPNIPAATRALVAQKPAGIILNYSVVAGRTFAETTALNQSFNTSLATWPLFTNRRGA